MAPKCTLKGRQVQLSTNKFLITLREMYSMYHTLSPLCYLAGSPKLTWVRRLQFDFYLMVSILKVCKSLYCVKKFLCVEDFVEYMVLLYACYSSAVLQCFSLSLAIH